MEPVLGVCAHLDGAEGRGANEGALQEEDVPAGDVYYRPLGVHQLMHCEACV